MVLLARKDEEGNTQTLYDHLHGAGRLASGFEDEFADISRTAAVLHDVGKVAQQFQTYLLSDDGHRGDVQHARQGAFVVNDFFESKGEIEEIAKEILELAISKHHGGLPDCIDESGNRAFLLGFTESDKSNEKYAYQEIKRGLNGLALDLQSNFRGSAEDIACFLKKIKSLGMSKDSIYFYLGLLVKLIYSRLVDADRTDAACSGRLGVTFYCELQKDEYIKRILQWHVDAAWPLTFFKKSIVEGAERVNVVQYEGAPSFTDIINCACGTSDRSSKSYKRFAKDVKERLIECMFGGAQFPMSILNAACHKVTRPMGYDNIRVWRRDFEIACSLWKKHYIDETRKQHRQEDVITMYLEPNRDDRDYLYGRLLALADNFEESVLRKQGVKDRPTNAIKLMSNFTAKPYTTWGTLWKQLMPYLKSANGGSWFRNEVDDVMALFKEGDFEDNKALSPMFLLGYSCQRRASKRKAQEISQKNNSNN